MEENAVFVGMRDGWKVYQLKPANADGANFEQPRMSRGGAIWINREGMGARQAVRLTGAR